MAWTIDRRGRVAVVTMTTNPVNAQNRQFFADLHGAFDTLEAEHPDSPVVLTGQDRRFSAGLDLGEHFPLFAGPPEGVAAWFAEYRATNMRLFTYPRPTIAAVNGHAFAGGLITSAVCDRRIAVDTDARFALNEVPIGILMPAVYVRMLTYAWGERTAARAALLPARSRQTPWSSTPSPNAPHKPRRYVTSQNCPTRSTPSSRTGSPRRRRVTPTAATGDSSREPSPRGRPDVASRRHEESSASANSHPRAIVERCGTRVHTVSCHTACHDPPDAAVEVPLGRVLGRGW